MFRGWNVLMETVGRSSVLQHREARELFQLCSYGCTVRAESSQGTSRLWEAGCLALSIAVSERG